MGLHSKFLVHWTGRDFDPNAIDIRQKFVDRLRDICQLGLYMNKGTETINGSNSTQAQAGISRICFTEIRLSQANEHANMYGKLGIGLHRDFVLERMGNPVIYVQNGINGVLIEHFDHLRGFVDSNVEMLKRLEVILGYLKNMSNPEFSDLSHYEEMEWRVVHLDPLEGKYITVEDRDRGIFRLKISPEDVKLIVFPDKDTKHLALNDKFVSDYFKGHQPVMPTLLDCVNF